MGNVDTKRLKAANLARDQLAKTRTAIPGTGHAAIPARPRVGKPKTADAETRSFVRTGARVNKWEWSAPYLMTGFGFLGGGLCLLIFGLDLLTGLPFHRASLLLDAVFSVCGAVLLLLSWSVYQALPRISNRITTPNIKAWRKAMHNQKALAIQD